jgi:hypothetical protein
MKKTNEATVLQAIADMFMSDNRKVIDRAFINGNHIMVRLEGERIVVKEIMREDFYKYRTVMARQCMHCFNHRGQAHEADCAVLDMNFK